MHPWHKQKGMGLARWRRKSPATVLLALILSFAQVQFALAAIVNTVTVTGSFNSLPVTSTAVETVDVIDAVPSVTITKTGTLNDDDGLAGISAGDTISYEVLADNTGNVSLTGISINDPLMPLTFDSASDSDSDGELDPDEIWRWTGSYSLTPSDISSNGGGDGDIDNTVTLTTSQLPDQTASAEVPLAIAPAYTLVKTATLNDDDGTPGQTAGDTIDYQITLTNTGNTPLTGIVVTDPLITLTFSGTDVGSDNIAAVGEVWIYTGSYILTQADIDSNGGGDRLLENTATAVTDQLPDQTAGANIPIVQNPAIDLVKVGDNSAANVPGDVITYTVTATNTGNMTLNNVVVSDPDITPNMQTCVTLAPLATCVLNGTYTTVSADFVAGGFTNNATVTSDEGAGNTAMITTPLILGAGLSVDKTVAPLSVNNPGDPVTYSVVVTNNGNVPLSGITVSDPLVVLDCGSGSATIPSLGVGAAQTCTATYNVTQTDFDNGTTLLNTATANDDGTYGVSDSDDATVTLTHSPAMDVTKTGVLNDDDGIGGVSAGDTITYTVLIENTGNVALSSVSPTDPMAALTLVSGDTDNDNLLDANEVWEFSGSYPITQTDIDTNGGGDGNIENTVTVSSAELPNQTANAAVPLNINPSMDIVKTGVLNDSDGNPGLTAGDTITYTVTLTNTGNIRLTNLVVNDPLVSLALTSGDTNSDNRLDTTEVWTYTGTTIITQGDLDTLGGGDGDIDNTVTVSSDQLPDQTASHELPIAPVSSLEITKVSTPLTQIFPTIYEFNYQITVRNNGAVTQTNIRVQDDIVSAIAPATLVTNPSVVVSGFAGTGGYNAGFDGNADQQILTGDVQLAPGDIGLITITVRLDNGAQTLTGLNTAFVSSDQILTPISSDDPTQTPGDSSDINPTPIDLTDSDGDGSPDVNEDTTADRENDGLSNSVDYDPTGYFYCQADGRILSGGLITVENLSAGGSQTGLGSSNGITILRDGSDGRYQFHATQAGTYQLSYVLPTTGIASTSRLSSGTIDLTSLLPDNPAVIGSGEFGSTGLLDDFTSASNPFYTRFEIEAGDPPLFNNNIPLQYCGSPLVEADKSVESGPTLQPDLSFLVTYRLNLTASGDEQVNNVQIVDDLTAVFGSGNYTLVSTSLDSAPAGFSAVTDPFYNGDSNSALLTSGGTLQPGESVSVLVTVSLVLPDGVYTNAMIGNGTSPLDGSAIIPSTDDAQIVITNPTDTLLVEKTALPGSATLGAPVAYTIRVANASAIDRNNIDVIDIIPNGMSYLPGTAKVDGVAQEPTASNGNNSGRELIWNNINVLAGDDVTITLTLVINASASAREFINNAYAINPANGARISNIAKAKVELEIEPVFQCSDLIGRVFDDLDKDGYYDKGEPGLPGVRLATANGLLITTDKFGRYNIACGAIPDEDIGSNFILKLDERSLPTGYRITSENPRVVRLTRGKLTKLNFAAANLRVVRLELNAKSFNPDSNRLTPDTIKILGGLLGVLDQEPSVLRIIYQTTGENSDIVNSRLSAVESLLDQAWKSKNRNNPLLVETKAIK